MQQSLFERLGFDLPTNDFERLDVECSDDLEVGKAAEHLVCADLITSGYRAFLSDQGLPYDILVDIDGRVPGERYLQNGCMNREFQEASYRHALRRLSIET